MRVSDYVVKRLVDAGVSHVFMVTGRGLLYLSDALAANKEIESISTHHEQGAGYAAYAYAEKTQNIGVCFVSTGCAATNVITSVMCAWQDEVPLLVISGQNMLKETTYHTHANIRTYGQQENDIISLVRPVTKYATMLEDAFDIGYTMDKALYELKTGRKGPVWIDIPLDIQSAAIDIDNISHLEEEEYIEKEINIDKVTYALKNSLRPLFLIGTGLKGAGTQIDKLVSKYNVPVVYDASVVDLYTNEKKLSIGCVGSMNGTRAGNFAIQNADLIISLGCRLTTMLTGTEREKFAREAEIVVVDIDVNEMKENMFREMSMYHCDPIKFVEKLLSTEWDECDYANWIEKCLHWKEIFPKNIYKTEHIVGKIDMYEVAEKLREYAEDRTVFITDAGIEELIFPTTLCVKEGQRVIHPVSQGAMGFAIPAVIGSFYASPDPIVCIVGDGSIMMNLQELQTIVSNQIPAKIIVINNEGYSVIRTRQKELFRKRTIGTDSSNGVTLPDYAKVADCFGINYTLIEQREDFSKLLNVLKSEETCICEIMCCEDQQYLRNSVAFNKKHRVLRRTLEDQAPFLDREVIYSEMIIKPIEME